MYCIARRDNKTLAYTKYKKYECNFVSYDLSHVLTEIINDNGDKIIASAKDFDFLSKNIINL